MPVIYLPLPPTLLVSRTLKNAIVDFFSPRRPLQPKRRSRREAKPVVSSHLMPPSHTNENSGVCRLIHSSFGCFLVWCSG